MPLQGKPRDAESYTGQPDYGDLHVSRFGVSDLTMLRLLSAALIYFGRGDDSTWTFYFLRRVGHDERRGKKRFC